MNPRFLYQASLGQILLVFPEHNRCHTWYDFIYMFCRKMNLPTSIHVCDMVEFYVGSQILLNFSVEDPH